jgi:phosphoribosylglycinamide formyltransferase-1
MAAGGIAVLISGRGSNLAALLTAHRAGRLSAPVTPVIRNRADAGGLALARAAGIRTRVIDHRDYAGREAFDAALARVLAENAPRLVVLAGFMRILTGNFIDEYSGRLLNIHPSLLPKYKGLHTHERALAAGDSEHGCTVHFVTPELDGGPPVAHAVVPVVNGDTPQQLAQRVQQAEHRLYPAVVEWFVSGRLKLTDSGPHLDGYPLPHRGVRYAVGDAVRA